MKKILHILLIIVAFVSVVKAQIKVACVGNSITAGYLLSGSQAYPTVLQSLLGTTKYNVSNFGVSGTTYLIGTDWSYWGPNGKLSQSKSYAPNIVVIELGTNDSKSSYNAQRSSLQSDIEKMILEFKALPYNTLIYLCIPPPAFNGNFDIQSSVISSEVSPAIKRAAQNQNATLIDLYTPLKDRPDLFSDGIHPTAFGASTIANIVYTAITSANVAVTGVSVSPSAVEILSSGSISLLAEVTPSYASNSKVLWASSNTQVATVDNTGLVQALQSGSATITATTSDGSKTATSKVTVISSVVGLSANVAAEFWTGITVGSSIPSIPSSAPNRTSTLSSLEIPSDADNNYLVRIRGYIIPSITGDYNFYIASDDMGELYLSTNNQPSNKARIAYNNEYTGSREWIKYSTQQSTIQTLIAGGKYYFEVLMVERSGGDNLAIGWEGPGLSGIKPIGSANIDKYIGDPTYADRGAEILKTISLHPNPAKTELYITGSLLENTNYEITSMEGKSLQSGILRDGSISIESLKAGIYLIKIKTEAGEKVQRFVKE